MCIQSWTCSFDIREDVKSYMTDEFNFCIDTEFYSFCLKSFHDSFERRLLVSVCHDWNYMSLLSNIDHVRSTESILLLSSQRSQRRLSFLSDSWSLLLSRHLRFGLWSFEFSILISMKSHVSLQSWITRFSIVSDSFLIVQSQDSLTSNRIL